MIRKQYNFLFVCKSSLKLLLCSLHSLKKYYAGRVLSPTTRDAPDILSGRIAGYFYFDCIIYFMSCLDCTTPNFEFLTLYLYEKMKNPAGPIP